MYKLPAAAVVVDREYKPLGKLADSPTNSTDSLARIAIFPPAPLPAVFDSLPLGGVDSLRWHPRALRLKNGVICGKLLLRRCSPSE